MSIGLDLRHLQAGLEPADPLQGQLDDSVRRLGDADPRAPGAGPRGPPLDLGRRAGLGARSWRARSPVRTVLDVTAERFPAEVEAAAYFVVSEALANALKHATPALIEVLADRVDGRLVVTVTDDGPGGAVAVPGSGLAGMGDRIAALGGELRWPARRPAAPSVRVELPCA